MEKVYCRIYGGVQKVMMRDFVTRKARRCRIVGYVRNMSDGSVEAYGEGKQDDLERWLAYIRKGPLLSRVERVEAQWDHEPPIDMMQQPFDSFDIVF